MQTGNKFFRIVAYAAAAFFLRFLIVDRILEGTEFWWLQAIAIIVVFGAGIGYVFRGTAKVIEETTDVLKDRTKLAGGFLQAFGTAFPDMVIGVVAAFISLQVRSTDTCAPLIWLLSRLRPLSVPISIISCTRFGVFTGRTWQI